MANKEKLFTEFTAPTTQEWLDKIEVDLKGADFQKRLVWRTNEGFNVQPFYRREDLANLKTPMLFQESSHSYVVTRRTLTHGMFVRTLRLMIPRRPTKKLLIS